MSKVIVDELLLNKPKREEEKSEGPKVAKICRELL
jgi:hypothetical protein